MQDFGILNLVSLLIACLSLGFALYQTAKLVKIKSMRDIVLKDIWKKQKDLSGMLILCDESKFPRSSCGKKSQDLEQHLASTIASLCDWKAEDLETLLANGQIDEFDETFLKRILKR
jgi:hypothetical protein